MSHYTVFSAASNSLSTPEKTKDNELVESHGDGSLALLSTSPVSLEPEKQEVTDVQQLKRKSPDEVCSIGNVTINKIQHEKRSLNNKENGVY